MTTKKCVIFFMDIICIMNIYMWCFVVLQYWYALYSVKIHDNYHIHYFTFIIFLWWKCLKIWLLLGLMAQGCNPRNSRNWGRRIINSSQPELQNKYKVILYWWEGSIDARGWARGYRDTRGWEMAQLVNLLPHRHKEFSLHHPHKKPSMIACAES